MGAVINRPPTEKRPLWSFVQAGYSPYSYISKLGDLKRSSCIGNLE